MKKFLFTAALIFAAALQAPAAVAAEAAPVIIPFKPPLGKPLHYRLVSLAGGATTDQAITVDFRPAGNGYFMTVATDLPAATAATEPLTALLATQVTFEVSSKGEITGISQEAGYLDALQKALATAFPAGSPGAEQFQAMIEQIRTMPAKARVALLSHSIGCLVRYAMTEHRLHDPVVRTEDTQTPFGPATVTVSQTLERVDGGLAHFTSVSRVPPEQLAGMLRWLAAGAKPPADFRFVAGETRAEADVETATGLVRHYSERQSITSARGGKEERSGRTTTLDLVR